MGDVAAMKNRTLLHPEARAEILRRIEALTPRSERRWGRMTPHQMVCHLSDACRAALGERQVPVIGTLWERTMIRWLAIHTNVKWPQGVRTVAEADQEIGGTRPTEFAHDVDELRGLGATSLALLRRVNDGLRNDALRATREETCRNRTPEHYSTFFSSLRSSRRSTTNLDMALFLGAELTKMMIRMTVTESAPLRYRQGAKQWMVSWELPFGATKPLNQVLVCWDAATLAKGNTTQAVAFAVQQPLDDLPYDRAALRLASLEWLVGRCDEATQKSRMQASGARASNQACHPKTLVRRNQRYTKIDAALREIAGSRPSSLEEVCQSLDGRKIGIPFAEPFVSARGWMAGFERDVKAARSWISKRWGELNLPSFARRGRKGPKK